MKRLKLIVALTVLVIAVASCGSGSKVVKTGCPGHGGYTMAK